MARLSDNSWERRASVEASGRQPEERNVMLETSADLLERLEILAWERLEVSNSWEAERFARLSTRALGGGAGGCGEADASP